jgi:hypothetical protein
VAVRVETGGVGDLETLKRYNEQELIVDRVRR